MSTKPWPGVTLCCDVCGNQFEWDSGFVAMSAGNEDLLLDVARDSDWTIFDDEFAVCPSDAIPACTCGHLWGEHEYDEGHGCTEEACECPKWVRAHPNPREEPAE